MTLDAVLFSEIHLERTGRIVSVFDKADHLICARRRICPQRGAINSGNEQPEQGDELT